VALRRKSNESRLQRLPELLGNRRHRNEKSNKEKRLSRCTRTTQGCNHPSKRETPLDHTQGVKPFHAPSMDSFTACRQLHRCKETPDSPLCRSARTQRQPTSPMKRSGSLRRSGRGFGGSHRPDGTSSRHPIHALAPSRATRTCGCPGSWSA
jgi:hypothetical protein